DSKGYIWFKTISHISRINTKDYSVRNFRHYNNIFSFISNNTISSIIEDHNGNIWVGTEDGLNFFDTNLEVFKRYYHNSDESNSINSNNVRNVFEDNKNNIWIGTDKGLDKYIPKTESFKHYYYKNINNRNEALIINKIYEDNSGTLMIGSENGLKVLIKENLRNYFIESKYDMNILSTLSIRSIIQDKNGIFWFGTLKGLFRVKKNIKKFNLYSKTEKGTPLFSNNNISSIYLENNILWVGANGGGLHKYNRKTGRITKFNSKNSKIKNDLVYEIFRDSKNRLWIGTQNGAYYFDSKRKTIHPFNKNQFENNRINQIFEDSDNNLWFCTNYGLYKYADKKLYNFFHNSKDNVSISSNIIYTIIEDENEFWIGTDDGLNKLDKSTEEFKVYNKKIGEKNCISSNEVITLNLDDNDKNILWIGTLYGLDKFNITNNKFTPFYRQDGLPDNVIYSIIENGNNQLWLSTNRGISRFTKDKEKFHNFGIDDGLQNYEFNIGASFKSEKGEIFFGGISGINSFFPDSIIINRKPPNIEITQIEIIVENQKKITYPSSTEEINLPYKNNLLTIEFAVLDYSNPKQNIYAYKLEGAGNEWINIGNRRYATFSELASGKYTFKVKGANSDYVWNEEGDSVDILVKTPIWRMKISYVVYIVFIVLLVFFLVQYRTRHLRKLNFELKEKELIAKQVAKQKEELSLKNKNITDSIIYAKRIQESLLPTKQYFKNLLPNSFILFKPKDIVSGDFYWVAHKDDKTFLAVVDCTGHGVPGAFMSIIGFELLRNIIDVQNIKGTDEIIYHLNKGIIDTIGKGEENISLKDGMDMSLCIIDKTENVIEYCGAFRPLYMIRENKLSEIKGGRFSVGMLKEHENEKIFKTIIPIKNNDVFYMFSDGYADQFGGPEGKKYKYRRFRHLLLNMHKKDMEEQKYFLDKSIEDWKGEEEQVDDILIVGIKPYEL
nr:SpoIIE family protein phosphatase [Bacteroidales bacterium]